MRECVHVEIAARLVQKKEDRHGAAVSTAFVRSGSQPISQGEIQGSARLRCVQAGYAPRARLSTLSAKRFLGSRQPAVDRHVAWMPARFTQFCQGYAHERAGRRRPLCGVVSGTKQACEPAALLELVRYG